MRRGELQWGKGGSAGWILLRISFLEEHRVGKELRDMKSVMFGRSFPGEGEPSCELKMVRTALGQEI